MEVVGGKDGFKSSCYGFSFGFGFFDFDKNWKRFLYVQLLIRCGEYEVVIEDIEQRGDRDLLES